MMFLSEGIECIWWTVGGSDSIAPIYLKVFDKPANSICKIYRLLIIKLKEIGMVVVLSAQKTHLMAMHATANGLRMGMKHTFCKRRM
jgi:hypothetical protein